MATRADRTRRSTAIRWAAGGWAVVATLLAPGAMAADELYDVDPDTGYRIERYRAPVPMSVPGGVALDDEAAHALHAADGATFVDVFPPKGLGADPLDGSWIISESHDTLPGAIWLPEVGRGHVEPEQLDYLTRNLERLSNGNLDHPFVFFCTADCWQSWNAARRTARLGYTGVHWYPNGTDGWRETGRPLVVARPLNFLDDSLPVEPTDAPSFPEAGDVFLQARDGTSLRIGRVDVEPLGDGSSVIDVDLDGEAFTDHFLSMRPFRCLEHASEWLCHLPYPYSLDDTVTPDDMTPLEYRLLFIRKRADEFGIDAWNGLYYRIAHEDGLLRGRLLEGDLNVLAEPPDPGGPHVRPIDLGEFIDADPARRFPTLEIRP